MTRAGDLAILLATARVDLDEGTTDERAVSDVLMASLDEIVADRELVEGVIYTLTQLLTVAAFLLGERECIPTADVLAALRRSVVDGSL
ncbi:MAG TPA: hypothetical protein VM262_14310 [Acidimicrobiales bacterium]|nr:hypothetical protein [Acidimicrobiales bacterium]